MLDVHVALDKSVCLINIMFSNNTDVSSRPSAPMEVGGLCGYWNERRASQLSDRVAYHAPPRSLPRPGLLESRLELLQAQLNRYAPPWTLNAPGPPTARDG